MPAICGATIFFGSHGFLDQLTHTGDSFHYCEEMERYDGEKCFLEAQVARDGNIIVANETAAVEFVYENFKLLEMDEPTEINQRFDDFKNGLVRK